MSSKRTPRQTGRTRPAQTRPATPTFTPVATRARHDGWTPERQVAFIDALAECACVEEAARGVGLSSTSAYNLRRHADAAGFRQAWDFALDYAVDRLADAALGRAIRGVVRPVFYKGEQIGERRDYDERLTMFLLRYRRPESYGAWMDKREARCDPEARATRFNLARDRVEDEAYADAFGDPRPKATPIVRVVHVSDDEVDDEDAGKAEAAESAVLEAKLMKSLDAIAHRAKLAESRPRDATPGAYPRAPSDFHPDVAATSATSAPRPPPKITP